MCGCAIVDLAIPQLLLCISVRLAVVFRSILAITFFWVTLSAAKSGVGFVTKFVFVVGSVIPVFFPVPSVDACCANVPHARNVWRWMAVKSSTLNQLI